MEVGKEGNKRVVPVDSLLVWSIANAKTISNNYGEIKIDKDITTERIDPIDAIIDAWKHAMKEEYRPDVNETVNEWLEQYEKYMKKFRILREQKQNKLKRIEFCLKLRPAHL